MTGNLQRVFLGWDRPALECARDFLLKRVHRAELDLSAILVVVPGGRAGRILLGMLVQAAEQRSIPFSPPRLCTPGEVADLILQPVATPAGPIARRAAWIEALRTQPAERLSSLVPHPPAHQEFRAWAGYAEMLHRCHAELAAEMLGFSSVPTRCPTLLAPQDQDRWTAAAAVQARYAGVLAEHGLVDTDLERMRLLSEPGPVDPCEVMLVGIAELTASARAALAIPNVRVTSLVFAPPDLAHTFCDLGCVNTKHWETAQVRISDALLAFEDHPPDQASRAMATISALKGVHPAHEVTIGAPDLEVVPALERAATLHDLPSRYAGGRTVSTSAPWRVLAAVLNYLEQRSFASLCRLVRSPDIEEYLIAHLGEAGGTRVEWWLTEMDTYAASSLHGTVDGQWRLCDAQTQSILDSVLTCITRLLRDLGPPASEPSGGPKPLSEWAQILLAMLGSVYEGVRLSQHDPAAQHTAAGITAIAHALHEASTLGTATPLFACTAAEAIGVLLDATADHSVPEPSSHTVIELLGWLELPLDPSPITIITGLNEGRVPAGFGPDPFLPDQVRRALGVANNARRYARDVYLLNAIIHSRRQTTLISGRRSQSDDPLIPSRLLFACDPDLVVDRIKRFTTTQPDNAAPTVPPPAPSATGPVPQTSTRRTSAFVDRPMIAVPAVTSMSVTAFKTYLASPYLFYLNNVLRLEESPQPGVELDALSYGSLLHTVLEKFGRSPVKDSPDAGRITEFVLDELTTLAAGLFGDPAPTPVWLQLEFVRRRLEDFARFQAARRAAGWIIDQVEWQPAGRSAPLDVDGTPFGLRGKIDRIDRHETSGHVAILDYKTGTKVKPPHAGNGGKSKWRDLQLPLYRHLGADLSLPEDPAQLTLGYITLPARPEGVEVLVAGWTPADLAAADDEAREVIRHVRNGEFHELGDTPGVDGVIAALCGLGFIGAGPLAEQEASEGEP